MAPSGMFFAVAAATLLASMSLASAQDVCTGECAGMWQQCSGDGIDGTTECCDDGFDCYFLIGVDYAQCRRSNSVNTGWVVPPANCNPVAPPDDSNVMCTGEEGAPPIEVEIGGPFTIATSTTAFPDAAFCVVVGSTMAPILPLTSSMVFASETGITRTLMCTVKKNGDTATCEFDITLTGTPNVPSGPPSPAPPPPAARSRDFGGDAATDEALPEVVADAFEGSEEDPPEIIVIV